MKSIKICSPIAVMAGQFVNSKSCIHTCAVHLVSSRLAVSGDRTDHFAGGPGFRDDRRREGWLRQQLAVSRGSKFSTEEPLSASNGRGKLPQQWLPQRLPSEPQSSQPLFDVVASFRLLDHRPFFFLLIPILFHSSFASPFLFGYEQQGPGADSEQCEQACEKAETRNRMKGRRKSFN